MSKFSSHFRSRLKMSLAFDPLADTTDNLTSSLQMFRCHPIASCMLLIALCFFLLVMLKENEHKMTIYVHSLPTMLEMSKIIQHQKQQLELISNQSRVKPVCSADQPSIKYPSERKKKKNVCFCSNSCVWPYSRFRQANDALTEIVMGTNDECGDYSIDAIIIVHTAAAHFHRRDLLRQAYGNYNVTKPYKLKVVFLIGSVIDATVDIQLQQENRQYGDTVVGAFLDVYENLTLKAVMGFRWLTETCPHVKLLIKMDDDVFFDVHKFYNRYWRKIHSPTKTNAIHCVLWHNAKVFRTGKWKVEKGLFRNASYPFPYCSGFFVVITPDLIKPMYLYGKSIDFFWIDDVYLFGMVPAAIGGVNFYQVGNKENLVVDSYQNYKACVARSYCATWAVLTNGKNEFDTEFNQLLSKRNV